MKSHLTQNSKARELAEKYPTLEEAKVEGWCKFFERILGRKTNENSWKNRDVYIFLKQISSFWHFCRNPVSSLCEEDVHFLVSNSIDSFKLGPKFGITTWPRPSALSRGLHRGLVDKYVAFARRAERCFHWVRGPGRWATKQRKRRLKRKLL